MTKNKLLCVVTLLALGIGGCPSNNTDMPDTGTDAGRRDGGPGDGGLGDTGPGDTGPGDTGPGDMGPADTGPPPVDANVMNDCAGYCGLITTNCTGAHAQYADMADCMAECTALAWPAGTPGDTSGNTLACRIYHGVAAGSDAATHCAHAGATGGGVCGANPFRTDAPTEVDPTMPTVTGYHRVDRMGMPAVATALVGPALGPTGTPDLTAKNDYNDGSPIDDAAFTYAPGQLSALAMIHGALDANLTTLGLTPCSATMMVPFPPSPTGMAPRCAVQSFDGNPAHPVAGLILPDTIIVVPGVPEANRHFPNGRQLADPVIDITLAVLLLDLTSTTGCGGHACTAATFATPAAAGGVGPINPPANDVAFLTTFPYLAPAH
jgi:hypothetical protein